MRQFIFLSAALSSLAGAPALAEEATSHGPSAPVWSVIGSLESTYTNNVFLAPSNTVGDVYWTPDFTVRADGKLMPDVYYRLYARAEFDAFSDETDANNAVARMGARLASNILDWTATVGYENRYSYAGVFENRLFTGHDLIATLWRSIELNGLTLSPGALLTYRFADVDESQRFRFEVWLGIEVPIDEKWSVVSNPFFEQFWFTDGLNAGREDSVYSVSLGLQYAINDNAHLTTEVTYETRDSNRSGLDYDYIEIGPRLDFVY